MYDNFRLSLQLMHFIVIINQHSGTCLQTNFTLWHLQCLLLTFFSPCLTYIISEIVKIHEVR